MIRVNKDLFFSSLIFSFIIFGPVFVLFGHRVDFRIFGVFYVFSSFLLSLCKYKSKVYVFSDHLFLILFLLLLILSYTIFIWLYLNDAYLMLLAIRLMVVFVLAVCICYLFLFRESVNKNYFDIIFYFSALNSLSIILMANFDGFREVVQSIQLQIKLLEVSGDIRMMAFNGLAGSTLSMLVLFGSASYFYMTSRSFILKNSSLFIILYSFLYSGRTGLILFILYVLFKLMLYYRNKYGLIFMLFPFFMSLMLLLALLNIFVENLHTFDREVVSTFRFISSMYTTDTGLPLTIERMLAHIHYPLDGIWFGSIGFNSFDGSEYHSDIGYIKMIYSIGIVGQVLFALLYLAIGVISLYYLKYEKSFGYAIAIDLFIIIFHFKAMAMGNTILTFILFTSFLVSLYRLRITSISCFIPNQNIGKLDVIR